MAKIFFDAATSGNPGLSSCAVVIITEEERYIFKNDLGVLDNHSAEWAAFEFALQCAINLNVANALVYTDSKLIEDCINDEKVKNVKFKAYLDNILRLSDNFALMFVKWVPRNQNKEANHYAQQALYKYTQQKKKQ
ncbi:ribonuclease HI family protein [Staphylococcus durrellii]|uniref:ribonuclease HI family protein n=1 Tax=Staphylococcus durrellii TaxID=2781773 RepID=UPI0018A06D88|nr:ribonuclease HI family protein [Staphylococcus durrellii]MBF7017111.1 ribonuclease HI family protein [Staphylococcus durrellii]